MDLKLQGKHVLITGSAGDIGLECARAFLVQGALVSLHYNSSSETLQALTSDYPTQTTLIQANATNEQQVIEAFKLATDKFGLCNVLVANHGIFPVVDTPIHLMTLDQFRNTIDVNLTGIFLFCREFVRQLKMHTDKLSIQQKKDIHAAIVVIGSTAGKFGEAGHIDYASSKSALMYGFLYTLKNEIVKIVPRATVNCVAPGWVKTKMAEPSIAQGKHYTALKTMPLRKVALTTDVANCVLTLSSQVTGGHLSGQNLMVDGGMEGRVLWEIDDLKQVA
eukprot:TRINITY_DN909_c0_g1_i1.p1 TRINITY_DN909_c0_g1~~TRINITY_DN909_c0_g1_i1.p1  ORF type:complete len:278 (+),score=41.45 TRINITY_DN909_c0_g1_i1:45-878(+)